MCRASLRLRPSRCASLGRRRWSTWIAETSRSGRFSSSVIYLAGGDGPVLVESVRDVCALKRPGFAFRTGAQDELALQLAKQDGGGYVIEVGIDLAAYLHETSGLQGDPGRELALFRFTTGITELVLFADQVKTELAALKK